MIRPSVDYDLCEAGLQDAIGLLEEKTDSPPLGVIVTSDDVAYLGKIMQDSEIINGLRINTIRNLPRDMWIVYNREDFVISEGA